MIKTELFGKMNSNHVSHLYMYKAFTFPLMVNEQCNKYDLKNNHDNIILAKIAKM